MGIIKTIRSRVFPASSKYFGQEMVELKSRLENIEKENKELRENIKVLTDKIDLYALQIYRKDNETNQEARIRLFSRLPDANGVLALYQKANTKLLSILHDICKKEHLDYWMWSGSAIATAGRGKSIPWDDDIDICMMREDLEKLRKIIKKNKKYEITIVYDNNARNIQYRFVSKNSLIQNFIDIVPCDWATNADTKNNRIYKELKKELIDKVETDERLMYWHEKRYLFKDKSSITYPGNTVEIDQEKAKEEIPIIEALFNEYIKKAYDANILCKSSKAKAIAYGLDNHQKEDRADIWDKQTVFPTKLKKYENIKVRVANLETDFCNINYQGWPFIPNDMGKNIHIPKAVIESPETIEEMEHFIKD